MGVTEFHVGNFFIFVFFFLNVDEFSRVIQMIIIMNWGRIKQKGGQYAT